jgi:hypothetical protein
LLHILGRSLELHIEGAVIIIEVDLGEGLGSAVAAGVGVISLRAIFLSAETRRLTTLRN